MKGVILLLIITFLSVSACKKKDIDKQPGCELDMEAFDFSFGIHYSQPDVYLVPGEQSDLDDSYVEEIRSVIGTPENSISGIRSVCHWFHQNFTFYNEGGDMIGKKTADELFKNKAYYGCHSAALVISSVLREFGFPTVMIETASIVWAYQYIDGTNEGFAGHVMTEVHVSDRWILLDNNGYFVEDYDCMNPFISMENDSYLYYQQGLFIYAKGVDIWDYGVRSESDTHVMMKYFANNLACFEPKFSSASYRWGN